MKKGTIIAVLMLISVAAFSQYRGGIWTYTWDIAFGTGETGDYIGQTSFRGLSITGSAFLTNNISLGGQFSWNTFYEKLDDETEVFDFIDEDDERVTGALFGTQFRYINSFPLLVTAKYWNKNPVFENFAFFGGLGLGTSIVNRRLEVGIFSADEHAWHFALAPEAGLVYGGSQSTKLFLSAQYIHAFATSETPEHAHFSLHIGFASAF